MAYATAAQLKTYAGIQTAGDDTLLTTLLARAQAILESAAFYNRVFEASANTTRYLDACAPTIDGTLLVLDKDLCQIASIVNGDGETLVVADYTTIPRNETPYWAIKLTAAGGKAWTYTDDPEGAIAITGRWAYSITPPELIVHQCIRLAHWLYKQRDTAVDQDRPQVSPDGVTLLPSALPKDVLSLIPALRRIGV